MRESLEMAVSLVLAEHVEWRGGLSGLSLEIRNRGDLDADSLV